jgi:hypothetical protein
MCIHFKLDNTVKAMNERLLTVNWNQHARNNATQAKYLLLRIDNDD